MTPRRRRRHRGALFGAAAVMVMLVAGASSAAAKAPLVPGLHGTATPSSSTTTTARSTAPTSNSTVTTGDPLPGASSSLPLGGLEPVLEIVSPVVSPVCGDSAILVIAIPDVLKGKQLPPQVAELLGPLYEVCGVVPTPQGGYECGLDPLELQAVADAEGRILGATIPVAPPLEGTVVLQLSYLEKPLVPKAPLTLTSLVAGTLNCKSSVTVPSGASPAPAAPGTSTTGPTVPTTAPPTSAPSTLGGTDTGFAPPGLAATGIGAPTAASALAPVLPPTTSSEGPTSSGASPSSGRVTSSVIEGFTTRFPTPLLVLPVVLALGLAYVASDLLGDPEDDPGTRRPRRRRVGPGVPSAPPGRSGD
ncbi:MAG TPA: hypothetical protein VL961_04165 [Acidimicrobiales bacterium]|nr:hypothetical protein [Acidimicrobiales bacterium]